MVDTSKKLPISLIFSKTRISEKLSDHLVFRHNILKNRQLTIWRLSANCLDDLLMKGNKNLGDVFFGRIHEHRGCAYELSDVRNSDYRNCMRLQNPENRNTGICNKQI